MSTRLEDVIRDAALKNRVGVKEDDPIMVLVTIMNRITQDQTEFLNAALENQRTACDEIALNWRKEATDRANQILNAALDAGRTAIGKGMSEGGGKVVAMIREESEKTLASIARQRNEMLAELETYRRFSRMILIANALTCLVAIALAVLR